MVVDDDVDYLNELSDTLASSGYDVFTTSDDAQVTDLALLHKPDVILLDLKLNNTSGFSIAKELRGEGEVAKTPIIAITGEYHETEYRKLLKLLNIQNCLIKPFQPLDVINGIEKVLN